jgi:hypothetical protein
VCNLPHRTVTAERELYVYTKCTMFRVSSLMSLHWMCELRLIDWLYVPLKIISLIWRGHHCRCELRKAVYLFTVASVILYSCSGIHMSTHEYTEPLWPFAYWNFYSWFVSKYFVPLAQQVTQILPILHFLSNISNWFCLQTLIFKKIIIFIYSVYILCETASVCKI